MMPFPALIQQLKAQVDDLTKRVEALEGEKGDIEIPKPEALPSAPPPTTPERKSWFGK